MEGTVLRLQLWDNTGAERLRSLKSPFFGRSDGIVLTYDNSNRPSFDHVFGWMREIKAKAPPDCGIVLCGNKSDLDNDRVVTLEEGQQLADEYGVQFFETSALTGQNVETMFLALTSTIKRKRLDELDYSYATSAVTPLRTAIGADGGNGSTSEDNRTVDLLAPFNGDKDKCGPIKSGCF
jgi:Ras-related protein Rab-8A